MIFSRMATWVASDADPKDYWNFNEDDYDWLTSEIQSLNLAQTLNENEEQLAAHHVVDDIHVAARPLTIDEHNVIDNYHDLVTEDDAPTEESSTTDVDKFTGEKNDSSTAASDVKNDETGEIETCQQPKEVVTETENVSQYRDDVTLTNHSVSLDPAREETCPSPTIAYQEDDDLEEYLNDYYMDDIYADAEAESKPRITYERDFLLSLRYAQPNVAAPSGVPDELIDELEVPAPAQQKGVKVIKLGRALDAEVCLNKSKDAWRPKNTAANNSNEDSTAATVKKFRSILNKITPEKFEKLMGQICDLEIKTTDCLEQIIDTIFDTAVNDQTFSEIYAKICKRLEMRKVKDVGEDGSQEKRFRTLLLNRCQKAFMQNISATGTAKTGIDNTVGTGMTQEEEEEATLKKKIKRLGNIRLIGELYKNGILIERIVHDCIIRLLKIEEEITLESGILMYFLRHLV